MAAILGAASQESEMAEKLSCPRGISATALMIEVAWLILKCKE